MRGAYRVDDTGATHQFRARWGFDDTGATFSIVRLERVTQFFSDEFEQHGYPLRSGWSAVWIPERQNGRG